MRLGILQNEEAFAIAEKLFSDFAAPIRILSGQRSVHSTFLEQLRSPTPPTLLHTSPRANNKNR